MLEIMGTLGFFHQHPLFSSYLFFSLRYTAVFVTYLGAVVWLLIFRLSYFFENKWQKQKLTSSAVRRRLDGSCFFTKRNLALAESILKIMTNKRKRVITKYKTKRKDEMNAETMSADERDISNGKQCRIYKTQSKHHCFGRRPKRNVYLKKELGGEVAQHSSRVSFLGGEQCCWWCSVYFLYVWIYAIKNQTYGHAAFESELRLGNWVTLTKLVSSSLTEWMFRVWC